MIEHFSFEYDYIFLEGASLNEYSDAKELMRFADKVVAVFNSETTIKQVDRESINFLKNLNGKLIGGILNRVEGKEILTT